MKSETKVYSLADLQQERETIWEGVCNYQVQNFLRQMNQGDLAFFYHSNTTPPGIVGLMRVVTAPAPALTYQMIYQQPVRHEFGLLQEPTLLVIGQEDRTTIGKNLVPDAVVKTLAQYPELGRAAAKDIPNSKLEELENVGHIPHLEAPDSFHRALLDFLKLGI